MSDQDSIFTEDNSAAVQSEKATTQEATTPASTLTQSEMVAVLVGEGKKYKTVDDLAKAYISADDFIEQLKAENRELKEKVVATKTIDDVLERLKQQQSQPVDQQATQANGSHISPSDLATLVEQTVTGLETKKQRESNMLKADAKMKELFGEKAGDEFSKVAATPDLRRVYMELAAVDPDKFVSLFSGSGVPKNTGFDTSGGVNTTVSYSSTNQGGRVNTPGTKEYFDNVRRTNPSMYYSQDFQLKMDSSVRGNPNLYYGNR